MTLLQTLLHLPSFPTSKIYERSPTLGDYFILEPVHAVGKMEVTQWCYDGASKLDYKTSQLHWQASGQMVSASC
jgi:hypothetical protein